MALAYAPSAACGLLPGIFVSLKQCRSHFISLFIFLVWLSSILTMSDKNLSPRGAEETKDSILWSSHHKDAFRSKVTRLAEFLAVSDADLSSKDMALEKVLLNFIQQCDASPVSHSINIGGQIFTSLGNMKGLLDLDVIDLLRCALHPMWAPYMVRDREGQIYLTWTLSGCRTCWRRCL